jgi:transcriptional regulator with XRE-family HTH domain
MGRHVPVPPAASAELGRRILEARRARGLGQEGAAEAMGVSRVVFSYLENARRSPSFGMLLAVARVLDTDPAVFVAGLHRLDG